MFPLHAAFAFETGLFMNPPQITLIWCQQFPADTLLDTMGVIQHVYKLMEMTK